MNVESLKDKIHGLELETKKLTAEVASSSGVLSNGDIQELEGKINQIRSHVEYLKASIRAKREIVLHG